jgi:hypothetical protein
MWERWGNYFAPITAGISDCQVVYDSQCTQCRGQSRAALEKPLNDSPDMTSVHSLQPKKSRLHEQDSTDSAFKAYTSRDTIIKSAFATTPFCLFMWRMLSNHVLLPFLGLFLPLECYSDNLTHLGAPWQCHVESFTYTDVWWDLCNSW